MSKKQSSDMINFDTLHSDWMNVTSTAVNQVHRADGYKGKAQGELIRPKASYGRKDK